MKLKKINLKTGIFIGLSAYWGLILDWNFFISSLKFFLKSIY